MLGISQVATVRINAFLAVDVDELLVKFNRENSYKTQMTILIECYIRVNVIGVLLKLLRTGCVFVCAYALTPHVFNESILVSFTRFLQSSVF